MSALLVEVAEEAEGVARRAAELICGAAEAKRGPFAICLSGGSTPRTLYELLARDPYRSRMPWSRLQLFLGDERFVPPDDRRSNFRMIRESLIERAPLDAAQAHPMPTVGLTLSEAARSYERTLQAHYGGASLLPDRPLFDIVLLGLGPDGHTASLLPGRPEQEETSRWVMPAPEGAPEPRLTLTPPTLNSAAEALFLVVGAEKRDALARLRARDRSIPASKIDPIGGLRVLADRRAMEEGREA